MICDYIEYHFLAAVNMTAIIIGASGLVAVCGVASVSTVVARKRLCGRSKKPSGTPTPERGDVLKQEEMDLVKPPWVVPTTGKWEALAQTEIEPFQPTFIQKECAFGSPI